MRRSQLFRNTSSFLRRNIITESRIRCRRTDRGSNGRGNGRDDVVSPQGCHFKRFLSADVVNSDVIRSHSRPSRELWGRHRSKSRAVRFEPRGDLSADTTTTLPQKVGENAHAMAPTQTMTTTEAASTDAPAPPSASAEAAAPAPASWSRPFLFSLQARNETAFSESQLLPGGSDRPPPSPRDDARSAAGGVAVGRGRACGSARPGAAVAVEHRAAAEGVRTRESVRGRKEEGARADLFLFTSPRERYVLDGRDGRRAAARLSHLCRLSLTPALSLSPCTQR